MWDLWCDRLDLCKNVKNEIEEVCNKNACDVLKDNIVD